MRYKLSPLYTGSGLTESVKIVHCMALARRLPFSIPTMLEAIATEMNTRINDLDSVDPHRGWHLMRDPGANPKTAINLSLQPAVIQWRAEDPYRPALMIHAMSGTGTGIRVGLSEGMFCHDERRAPNRFRIWHYDDRDNMARCFASIQKSPTIVDGLLRGVLRTLLNATKPGG